MRELLVRTEAETALCGACAASPERARTPAEAGVLVW